MSTPRRTATISRDTNETKVQLTLSLDGGPLELLSTGFPLGLSKTHALQTSDSQTIHIDTGIGFLDHMLHALAKHAGWSLVLHTKGDLYSTPPHPIPHPPY